MNVNERIASRRQECDLTDTEIADRIGIPVDLYEDMEKDEDELYTLVKLSVIRDLCEVLALDYFDLFDLKCAFCDGGLKYEEAWSLPRHELLKRRKMAMHLSDEKLGNRISLNLAGIASLQSDETFLDAWPLYAISDLASAMSIPLQILLNVKCRRCGH